MSSASGGEAADKEEFSRHQIRLPGFMGEEPVGLGEVVKRATSYLGVTACDSCEHRATVLNRWLAFTGSRKGR